MVSGKPFLIKMIGEYAYVPHTEMSERPEIVIGYDLPEKTTIDTINGVEYRYLWRGDDIVGVVPNAKLRPLYQ
jgi:hypothetical protein